MAVVKSIGDDGSHMQGGLGCLGKEHTIHYEHIVEMKSL